MNTEAGAVAVMFIHQVAPKKSQKRQFRGEETEDLWGMIEDLPGMFQQISNYEYVVYHFREVLVCSKLKLLN